MQNNIPNTLTKKDSGEINDVARSRASGCANVVGVNKESKNDF